jgi:hypothetical protein
MAGVGARRSVRAAIGFDDLFTPANLDQVRNL